MRCDRLAKYQPAEITMFQISEVLESLALNVWRSFLPLPRLIESESIVDESQRNENGRFLATADTSSASASALDSETGPNSPTESNFEAALALIERLPLSDDEKTEAVRRLLARSAT